MSNSTSSITSVFWSDDANACKDACLADSLCQWVSYDFTNKECSMRASCEQIDETRTEFIVANELCEDLRCTCAVFTPTD